VAAPPASECAVGGLAHGRRALNWAGRSGESGDYVYITGAVGETVMTAALCALSIYRASQMQPDMDVSLALFSAMFID